MKFFYFFMVIFAVLAGALARKDPVCGLQHSADGVNGRACLADIPSWSYKSETNECINFVYGGCGGNENRFPTKSACEKKCVH